MQSPTTTDLSTASATTMSERHKGLSCGVALARELVSLLPGSREGLFNPYQHPHPLDAPGNGPKAKLARLGAHLDCQPRLICIGEAPGYQGAVISGLAFTSEAQLMAGTVPRLIRESGRLSMRPAGPYKEPSATAVWAILYELGLAESTVMWNAIQMHPYVPGNQLRNRTPTQAEVAMGRPALLALRAAFPSAKVVAIGQKAQGLLKRMDLAVDVQVRHPSFGGKPEFDEGMRAAFGR